MSKVQRIHYCGPVAYKRLNGTYHLAFSLLRATSNPALDGFGATPLCQHGSRNEVSNITHTWDGVTCEACRAIAQVAL
jgi:hypothetical protein